MWSKWDIVYISKFPESIKCTNSSCGKHFMLNPQQACTFCNTPTHVSNIIGKIRPVLLWSNQNDWFDSMAFGIPLSSSDLVENMYNELVNINDYTFVHTNNKLHRPMRAVICQSTRIDGCVLNSNSLIGKLTNTTVQDKIQNKLFSWLFK